MPSSSMGIWVIAEQIGGRLAGVSLELLGRARTLSDQSGGAEVVSVLLGCEVESLAPDLAAHGADRILVVDDPRLRMYQNDTYGVVLEELIRREKPDIVLFGATAIGGELAPTVAAKLGTGLAAHCVDLRLGPGGELIQVVPAFGGKVLGDILCPSQRPQMASVKPGIFRPVNEAGKGLVLREQVESLSRLNSPLRTRGIVKETPPGLPLEQADVVVAGGWGVGGAENWRLLQDLASRLGGAVGCTRPALDAGWTEGEHTMIGTSGKTIRPKFYIGFGISGATHHVVGMKDSGLVVSVNTDPKAPIFEVSDYAVIGDAATVASAILERLDDAG
ncbi:MAG: electron transfer flavoprotein subunit alpha/FixB family protein [Firmicutes bacterium]|nr:electron transfer flavoprotein subunit alpha/FixB family protein [Bacillota bacterium]